ncbi:MAG: filamentous hemagglutinin N-terminal domain-containing protein [Cyanobacteria bacterium P01_F01_bin.143]
MSLFFTKNKYFSVYLLFLFSAASLGFSAENASAQIIPDSTLPNNTEVLDNNNLIEIVGGTTEGNNLFHSFEQFSLEQGNTVFFNNAESINNIFSRVTGSSISNIDGLIKANGTADLFLINPNGIIFGENATLDIGGSFIGSTADSVLFQDGSQFSAIDPGATPLLTVNIPVGLQFGSEPGDIAVKGRGHNISFDFDFFILDRSSRNLGLAVKEGNTIGLIGNNILFDGGNLTAEAGNIELGSATATETVELVSNELGWTFNYNGLGNGNIDLVNDTSIDVSGDGSGNIQIQGHQVNLIDGSVIFAKTEGDNPGGLTKIKADQVSIFGSNTNDSISSSIQTDVSSQAIGNGGKIIVETNSLLITDEEDLSPSNQILDISEQLLEVTESEGIISNNYGSGNGGDITIFTKQLINNGGGIGSVTYRSGKGGDIEIVTEQLAIGHGGRIGTAVVGSGQGGEAFISAKQLTISRSGQILAITLGSGDGGHINLFTEYLEVRNGAQISSATLGLFSDNIFTTGNGGSVNIEASNIKLDGFIESKTDNGVREIEASGILANAFLSSGAGGNIDIKSDRLTITNGATINASNFPTRGESAPGTGPTGTINIKTNYLELDNDTSNFASSITTASHKLAGEGITLNVTEDIVIKGNSEITAETEGDEKGGSIIIKANNVDLLDEARLTVNSSGLGDAGHLILVASDRINLNQGKITANSEQSGGGKITIDTNFLDFRNESEISTSVLKGSGGGGNINIDSNILLGRDGSQIITNADEGMGGNINIDTEIFVLSFDSEVDASSRFGIDGNININSLDTSHQISVVKLPENLIDSTALVAAECSVENIDSLITTGKGGLAENPRQNLRSESVWEDLRNFASPSPATSSQEIVEAKAWTINQNGNIELLSYIPAEEKKDYQAMFNQCKH